MNRQRILRFHPADKLFHGINAILWILLAVTGMIVYFCNPESSTGENLMWWHILCGIFFFMNVLGFMVYAPDRFALILHACLTWDKNTFLWFRNLGGYPRRFFGIPFGPEEVAPQGRYNGGQKASYLLFMFSIFSLAITGVLLWIFAPALDKDVFRILFIIHVWGSIIVTVLVVFVHIPLALLSRSHFYGIWGFGTGDITMEAAEHHAPTWVNEELILIKEETPDEKSTHGHH